MLAYRLILAGILMVLLGGCAIPVAPFYDEPFPKDLQTKLNAGASQDEVGFTRFRGRISSFQAAGQTL